MKRTHKIAIGSALLLSVVAVGGAVGATQLSPKEESQAVIDDAAKQLGVQPGELSNALKQALKNRVDAAVADGRLTKEEGQTVKERIDADEVPFPFFGDRHLGRGHHDGHLFFHAKFETAAEYLGMSEADLRSALEDGKSLAQVARDRDKSVDGLIDAMVQDADEKLKQEVEDGRLTEAERKDMLSGLTKRITDLVNGRFPAPPRHGFRRFDRGGGAEHRPFVF